MDETVVRRIKRLWFLSWVAGTGVALAIGGFPTAVVVALGYAGVSLLAFVAFFLYFLLGDAPVVPRILLILAFLLGVLVEIGALVSAVGYLTGASDG